MFWQRIVVCSFLEHFFIFRILGWNSYLSQGADFIIRPDSVHANSNRSGFPINGWVGLLQPWHAQDDGSTTYSRYVPYDKSFEGFVLHPYAGFVCHPPDISFVWGSIRVPNAIRVRLLCLPYLVFANKLFGYKVPGGS